MKHTPIIHQIRIAIPIILYCNCLTLSTGTTSNLTSRVTYSADMRDANRKGGSNGEGDVLTQDNFTPSSVQRQTAVKNKIGLRYPTRHCPLDSIEDLENLCPQMLQGLNTAYYGQKNRAQDSTPTKPGSPFALKLQANQNGSEALYNTTAGFENSPEVSTWKSKLIFSHRKCLSDSLSEKCRYRSDYLYAQIYKLSSEICSWAHFFNTYNVLIN